MTTPAPRPAGKSTTSTADKPRTAQPAPPHTTVGEPEVAARQGVLSVPPRSNRFPSGEGRGNGDDPTPDRPGIRIYAPPVYRSHDDGARWSKRPGDTPYAAYACACGRTRTATGRRAVAALVGDYEAHKSACAGTSVPLAFLEGRTAA
ncbi:hypothetical protein [Streptomyces sp. NPDC001815]|uniref:hypothetical protein n=1 Tax=Streptomyces sp. NPDC001815 TaxID=3154526 RepID=UPI00331D1742